jgi:hypothetical protein
VTEAEVANFLALYNQTLQKKILDVYNGRFIRTIRFRHVDNKTYISSRVSAEMTKKLCVYNVDVLLDVHGVVQESQCECTAGTGPNAHCKHVAVVLYALTRSKEGILTTKTCTQSLQSFHQVKSYGGSPVKCKTSKFAVMVH